MHNYQGRCWQGSGSLADKVGLDNHSLSAVSIFIFEQIMILDRLPSEDVNEPPSSLCVDGAPGGAIKFLLWLLIFLNGHQVLLEDDDAPGNWIAKNASGDIATTGIQI